MRAIALGIGGLVVALVLTVGAFAIAGQDISQPAGVPMFTAPPGSPSPSHNNDDPDSPGPKESPSASPGDDHGGSPGPDDVSSSVGSGEPGSDDSGSGSDDSSNSGSDSSNSGSGSSSSGSSSDGHGDD